VTDSAELKLTLAVRGARLDASVRERTDVFRFDTANGRVRSLALTLPGGVCVDVPVDGDAEHSPFLVTAERGAYFLEHASAERTARTEVRPVPPPRFYARRTSRDTPMAQIATVRGSHLIVHPGASCGFSVSGTPCRFCVEGARAPADTAAVPVADVLDVVRAAFDEGACTSVYFNTGFFDGEDGGIAFLTPYIEAVRRHFDTSVAAQVHPPRTNRWIDRTYAIGVDALSYNLEIFDADALNRHCIGRVRYIGRDRYLEALAYAATVFPSGTVWSDLVIGLESADSTRAGIDALAAMGVVPVASLFCGEHAPNDLDAVAPLLAHLHRTVKARGTNMGWVRDLSLGITPLEARHFAGGGARMAVTVQNVTRSRLGGLAARGLARIRRRLRVRPVADGSDGGHD
jgi:hypothetical protein